ncbi:MAG: TetR/AcrR family transcriptional regulator [Candidatus Cloacimonadaceae bacterium]|nr:TetR/AcrR family transcriptional regulator [Candidatus Cloacimonadaceae bacterium]
MDEIIEALIPEGIGKKKAALVDTEFSQFKRHGFQRVTIEDVCATTKVSKATFYKYYSGKDALIVYGRLAREDTI